MFGRIRSACSSVTEKAISTGGSKILIVMVWYQALLQAKTIRTLGDCFVEDTNAPTGQPVPGLPFRKRWRLEEWRSAVGAKRRAAAGDTRP